MSAVLDPKQRTLAKDSKTKKFVLQDPKAYEALHKSLKRKLGYPDTDWQVTPKKAYLQPLPDQTHEQSLNAIQQRKTPSSVEQDPHMPSHTPSTHSSHTPPPEEEEFPEQLEGWDDDTYGDPDYIPQEDIDTIPDLYPSKPSPPEDTSGYHEVIERAATYHKVELYREGTSQSFLF